MADIFFAEREGDAGVVQPVALKRLRRHLLGEPSFVAMFLDEARLAARLTHQNVAQVIDFGSVDGEYFLAMEYLDGVSLHGALKRSVERGVAVPSDVVVAIVARALDGLHYAHTLVIDGQPLHIVHRDVSLSNVFLTWSGNVKVIDFGIARAANRQQEDTSTGVFKGKLSYASPEHLAGEDLDARSDVFSMGIVAWELLTGQRLFRRPTELATMHAITTDPIPSVRSVRPELPAAFDQVLARALDRNRDTRFASAQDFRRALEALQAPAARVDDWLAGLFPVVERSSASVPAVSPGPGVAEPATRTSPRLAVPATLPLPQLAELRAEDRAWWPLALTLSAALVLVLSGLLVVRRSGLEPTTPPSEARRAGITNAPAPEPAPSSPALAPSENPLPLQKAPDVEAAVALDSAPAPETVPRPEPAPKRAERSEQHDPPSTPPPKTRPARPAVPAPAAPQDNPLTL
ncbi:MAG: protein kinase [Myxococcaceae bacterium]|nr:protein kinase [Myxococcaceae bacterium]